MRRTGMGLVRGVVAVLLLLGAAQAGLAVPSEQVIRGVVTASALDYAGLEGSVAPLSDEFVAQVLGLEAPEPAAESAPAPVATAVPAVGAGPQPAAADQGSGPAAVTHPATNDDVADAYLVSSVPFSARTDASDASRQPGEPDSCAPAGPTLWYRYQPPLPVGLTANTVGSSGVVALAVFVGDEPGELRQIRCHVAANGEAQVSFAAAAGTSYLFQVTLPAGGGRVGFNLDALGTTARVSGSNANGNSGAPTISADGRYVVFHSWATDLVEGDRNNTYDVFLTDRRTGAIELISVASDGTQGNSFSGSGINAISDDGRYVAFFSMASTLVAGDTNGWSDVFVRDRLTGSTERVSVSSSGAQGRAPRDPVIAALEPASRGLSISADGKLVAFQSDLVGLVPGDVELEADFRGTDVFVHDRTTGQTEMVSVSSEGAYANDWSDFPSMTADGRYVAFRSFATNLTDDPTRPRVGVYGVQTGSSHVYVHDRMTGWTELVSRAPGGPPGNDDSWPPSISGDGRYLAFASWADNLVADDDNASMDVFVLDRHSGSFDLVSISTSGDDQAVQRAALSRVQIEQFSPGISDDGRYVVFVSDDPGLEPGDTNPIMDIFVRDRIDGRTFRVNESSTGAEANHLSTTPVISRDGRHVAFTSWADNLVENDTNRKPGFPLSGGDTFVHTLGGRL